jgi:hypothetical protein
LSLFRAAVNVRRLVFFLFLLTFSFAAAAAQTIEGKVTNGTTDKPAAGVEVVLLRLAQGMDEGGRTRTDAQGRFSFKVDDPSAPYLIRVTHQGVNYFARPEGGAPADIVIFDAAASVDGITVIAHVQRLEAQSEEWLEVQEVHALRNASNPPRTWMAPRTYQVMLPEGAQIESGMAASATSMPVTSAPVPDDKEKNRYGFVFPIRPGDTRFQIAYRLPYGGKAKLQPRLLYPAEHKVVMLPKSMQFKPEPAAEALYQPMDEPDAQVRVATSARPGQPLGFEVSGTGVIPATPEGGEQQAGAPQTQGPGGGLGPPIEAPDPLKEYRWYILGGFVVVLAVAGFLLFRRPAAAAPSPTAKDGSATPRRAAPATSSNGHSDRLLEALKDELFHLETERHQGRIGADEYEKARAALDHTIQRAVARRKS